jgi:putative ABC transport system permease protein
MHQAVRYVDEPVAMSDNALLRVRDVDGVAWATPLFVGSMQTKLPSGAYQGTLVIGVDDASLIGLPPTLVGCKPEDLRRSEGAFVDVIGAADTLAVPVGSEQRVFGSNRIVHEGTKRPLRLGDELSLNDHRLIICGKVDLGPRFISKPVLYTTYSRASYISPRTRQVLSYVLVKADAGVDPAALAARIERETDLKARTAQQFKDDTYWYYVFLTGVVSRIVFMISTAVVVGLSVSSLLFYLFTTENARYYAALMALGCRGRTLVAMVVVQAFVSTFTGFGLGVGGSVLLGKAISGQTMPYAMVWQVLLASMASILVVALVASTLSVRRILKLEPAMVFR